MPLVHKIKWKMRPPLAMRIRNKHSVLLDHELTDRCLRLTSSSPATVIFSLDLAKSLLLAIWVGAQLIEDTSFALQYMYRKLEQQPAYHDLRIVIYSPGALCPPL